MSALAATVGAHQIVRCWHARLMKSEGALPCAEVTPPRSRASRMEERSQMLSATLFMRRSSTKAISVSPWRSLLKRFIRNASCGLQMAMRLSTMVATCFSFTIPNVKLKHVATIVESLIAIWSPHDAFRMNRFSKLRQGDTEMAFVLLLRIKSVAESICDLSSIRLARERGGVTSAHGNAPSDFIKRACQHRTIW